VAAWVNRVVRVPAQVAELVPGPAAPVAEQVLAPVVARVPAVAAQAEAAAADVVTAKL